MSHRKPKAFLKHQSALVRSQFKVVREGMRPHNRMGGVDLRKTPICYLCGNPWELVEKSKKGHKLADGFQYWRCVIQCTFCKLLTYAEADRSVLHSREWIKHR